MKLLFDENISFKLVSLLSKTFPNSTHIELLDWRGTKDLEIWNYAKEDAYIIVSKDNDFRQRAFLLGSPPKVIWLSVGNAGTGVIASLLETNVAKIEAFANSPSDGLLILALAE